jgi:hypothetical protein
MSARFVLVVFYVAQSGMFECRFIIFEGCVLTVTNIVLITATLARNDGS